LSLNQPYEDDFELLYPPNNDYARITNPLPTSSSLLGSLGLQRGDVLFKADLTSTRKNRIEHVVLMTSKDRIVHARGAAWGVRRDDASLYAQRVAAVTRYNPNCPLVPGHKGNRVRALQRALNERIKAGINVDGDFGGKTRDAVRAYQTAQKLSVTGIGDPATLAALGMAVSAPTPNIPSDPETPTYPMIKIGARDPEGVIGPVTVAQSRLAVAGEPLGTSGKDKNGIDGSFGDITDKAVRSFQRKNGLSVDGEIGPATWGALLEDAGEPNDGTATPMWTFTLRTADKALLDGLVKAHGGTVEEG